MSLRNGIITILALTLSMSAIQTMKAVDTNVATSTLSLNIPEVS